MLNHAGRASGDAGVGYTRATCLLTEWAPSGTSLATHPMRDDARWFKGNSTWMVQMRKLSMLMAVLAINVPAVLPAQLTGSGCFVGAYQTCANWSLVNTSGNLWTLGMTNTSTTPTQKFGELYLFFNSGTPLISNVTSTPTGWEYGGAQNPASNAWFNGVLGVMGENVQFVKGPDILIGQSALIYFTLTGATPVGVGVHSQPDGGGYDSQRIRFGESSVVPEPSTYALMATGLLGLVGVVRRRGLTGRRSSHAAH